MGPFPESVHFGHANILYVWNTCWVMPSETSFVDTCFMFWILVLYLGHDYYVFGTSLVYWALVLCIGY